MKKTLVWILAVCLCLGLCACGGNSEPTEIAKSAEAQKTDALILAIGEVTADSEAAIMAAQASYDALTDAQKAEVENYDILKKAQELFPQKKIEGARSKVVTLIEAGDYLQASGVLADCPEIQDYADLMKQCGEGVLAQYIKENGEEKESGKFFLNLLDEDGTQISVWYLADVNSIQYLRYSTGNGVGDAMVMDYVLGGDKITYMRSTTSLGTPTNYQEGIVNIQEYTGSSNGKIAENSSTPLIIYGLTVTKVQTVYDKQTRGYSEGTRSYINEMLNSLFAAVTEAGYKGTVADMGFAVYASD